MPRLLLLSELHPALDDFVAGAGLVGVLPDAGDAIGEPAIADQARAHLRRAGAHTVDVDLDGDMEAQLERLDVLVVTGGDAAALGARLRSTGAGALIALAVRGGLHYAGLSAGAMVAGPSLAPHVDVDPSELPPGEALRGLELTAIHVLVHHGRDGRAAPHTRALERYGTHATLVPLADADGILVGEGVPELFGPQRGERLRSALPGDAPALAGLLDDVDWPDRLSRPGVVVATHDGDLRGVLALGKRTLTSLGVPPGALDVERRLRAWAVAATT